MLGEYNLEMKPAAFPKERKSNSKAQTQFTSSKKKRYLKIDLERSHMAG